MISEQIHTVLNDIWVDFSSLFLLFATVQFDSKVIKAKDL